MPSSTSLNRRSLPGSFAVMQPARTVQSASGTFYLYEPKRGLVFCECIGRIDSALAAGLEEFGNDVMDRDGRTAFFHDWSACSSYSSAARTRLTAWSVERRSTIRSVVVLTYSKLVSMGVATANLSTTALGLTMRAHNSRPDFEKAFLAAAEAC